jgi:hypothetical protein
MEILLCLVISAVVTWRTERVNREYAKQGLTPPGVGLVEKWLDGRKTRGEVPQTAKPARYGMWRFFWQQWQALWQGITEEHAARNEKLRTQRLQAIADGREPPKPPTFKQQMAADRAWVQKTIKPPAKAPEPAPSVSSADPPTAVPAPASAPPPPSAPPTPSRPEPAHPRIDSPGGTMPQPATQSGEVTGIRSAIAYEKAMAAAHQEHAASGEVLAAALVNMKVGAGDISLVQQAAAASQNAADLFAAAADALVKNNQAVQEAYASHADAADKKFQTAE